MKIAKLNESVVVTVDICFSPTEPTVYGDVSDELQEEAIEAIRKNLFLRGTRHACCIYDPGAKTLSISFPQEEVHTVHKLSTGEKVWDKLRKFF